MSNDTVVSLAAPARVSDPLTELVRTGARRLIEAAVTAGFEEYLSGFVHEKLPDGRQRVVRNGHLPERKILTGLGDAAASRARSRCVDRRRGRPPARALPERRPGARWRPWRCYRIWIREHRSGAAWRKRSHDHRRRSWTIRWGCLHCDRRQPIEPPPR